MLQGSLFGLMLLKKEPRALFVAVDCNSPHLLHNFGDLCTYKILSPVFFALTGGRLSQSDRNVIIKFVDCHVKFKALILLVTLLHSRSMQMNQ